VCGWAFASLFVLCGAVPADIATTRLGPGTHIGWDPSLALGPDGAPHVLYSATEGALYHSWYDGSRWQDEEVDGRESYLLRRGSAVDGAGGVHIAFEAFEWKGGVESTRSLVYGTRQDAGWELVSIDHPGRWPVISLRPDGTPLLLVVEGETLVFLGPSPDGGWTAEPTGLPVKEGARCHHLAVDASGGRHLLFLHERRLRYATDATGTWEERVLEDPGFSDAFLALDGEGRPHVVTASRSAATGVYRHHRLLEGGEWRTEDMFEDFLDPTRFRIPGGLATAGRGAVFLPFGDWRFLRGYHRPRPALAYFDGAGWREMFLDRTNRGSTGDAAVGPDGAAHVLSGLWPLQHRKVRLPDLSAAWESAESSAVADGVRFAGTLRVRNDGPGRSRRARLAFYLSDDERFDAGDEPVAIGRSVAPLRSGGERAVPVSLRLPADGSGRRLLAVLDPDGRLDDLDRPNNLAVAGVAE
jgi:hypothetical protein